MGAFTSGAISSSSTSARLHTRHAMIALTSLIVASAALLLPQNTPPQQPLARRAILNQAASFAAAAALLPLPAIADLGDLDMGEAPPPVAMKVESLAIEPAADSGGGGGAHDGRRWRQEKEGGHAGIEDQGAEGEGQPHRQGEKGAKTARCRRDVRDARTRMLNCVAVIFWAWLGFHRSVLCASLPCGALRFVT